MPCLEATLNKFYITLSSAITRNFIHFHLPKYVQAHDFVDTSYNPITQLLQHSVRISGRAATEARNPAGGALFRAASVAKHASLLTVIVLASPPPAAARLWPCLGLDQKCQKYRHF